MNVLYSFNLGRVVHCVQKLVVLNSSSINIRKGISTKG